MSRPKADPVGNPRTSLAPARPTPENIAPRQPTPPVPSHLGEVGRAIWAEVWAAGGDAYSPVTDGYVIERYATLHERRHSLMSTINAEGILTVGSQGQTVLHPAARHLAEIEKNLGSLEDKLGLNPESRIRLGIAAVEKESKLDAFLRQTQN